MASLKQNPLAASAALYAATLLWLALAAWNPLLPGAEQALDLMLLVDESASIERRQNDELWSAFLRQAQSLPAHSRISLMRFADRAVLEVPWTAVEDFARSGLDPQLPRRQDLDPGASAIRAAIDSALQQAAPDRTTAILISSDGRDTGATLDEEFAAAGVNPNLTLFHLAPARAAQAAGARIESIDMPERIGAGQALAVGIAIRAGGAGAATLEITRNREPAITRELSLQAGELTRLAFRLAIDQPGAQLLEFTIRDPQRNVVDRLRRLVDAGAGGRLLCLADAGGAADAGLPLPPGWTLERLRADQAAADETLFDAFDVVLLDDLAAAALDPGLVRNLARAVRQSALGLIVVGGPRSFGSGGYRHAPLEDLLPVIAESPRPVPAAAFLFLLDKSGSMEAAGNRQSRLADALSAVVESAKSIRPGDESALLAFDREVQVLLPLQRRADLAAALDRPWQLQPGGGTRLGLALEQAVQMLGASESPRRYLLLVTDGVVDVDDFSRLQAALRQGGMRLIVLATGNDGRLDGLRQLAAASGGRLLQVEASAQLPRFMRQQLDTARHSWSAVPVAPRTVRQPPFVDAGIDDWENLPGYQLTRARPSALVYLATDEGDPLLALGQYGAGSVAALPGGIPASASAGSLAPALIAWIDSRRDNPYLQLEYDYAAARVKLVIDAVDAANRWQSSPAAEVLLTDPSGGSQRSRLELVAPGRYAADLPAPGTGIYRAAVSIGAQRARFDLYLQNDAERRTDRIAAWYRRALDEGTIKPWTAGALAATLASASGADATRRWWLVLALITFVCLVTVEHRHAFVWLGKRLSRMKMAGARD